MASRKQHCEACIRDLGQPFDEVHKWLDGRANIFKDGISYLDMNHRRHRHHEEGVEEIRKMFGDEAAEAAEHHIKMDCGRIPKKSDYNPARNRDELCEWDKIFGKS